jgi:hypothetical protein
MAKKLANNYRLYIQSTTAGTYNEIKGQGNLSIARQAGTIDLTSKSDAPYGLSAPGLRTVTVSCAVIPDLPDATGYTRAETLSNDPTTPSELYQIRKAPYATPGDVVFQAAMYTNISSTNLNQNEGVAVSIELSLAAAPTVDTLA